MNRIDRVIEALGLTARHASEVSVEFMRGMASRMAMSMEKYGKVADSNIDGVACAITRLEKYKATGNTEYLMDAANFCMIEYMKPNVAGAHFKAEDSAASPGRTGKAGHDIGQASNTSSQDNVRLGGSSMRTSGGHYRREGD